MLRFGPNGIPLSCKGRTWLDAVKDVKALDLEALEFQLIRGIGQDLKDPEIQETHRKIRENAEELDIFLAVHAPYYMDLLGSDSDVARSLTYLKWSGEVAHQLGARVVVTHVGFYNSLSKEDALEKAVVNLRKVRDHYRKKGYTHYLGIEVNGKQNLFGSFEEVLSVTKRIARTIPIMNFAHMHSRERGFFKRKEDFQYVIETLLSLKHPFVYTLYSGVEHDFEGNEIRYTPIKRGDMKFEPLAEVLLDHEDEDIIVISSSPLLEHDAQYMKVILNRIKERRLARMKRDREAKRK